jgi:SAM-dependent methyltransferase
VGSTTGRAHGRKDWDSLAPRFDSRVCHVLAEDRLGAVDRALAGEARRLAKRGSVLVGDFGCGVGRALPLLCRRFGRSARILAVDGSAACLDRARSAVRDPSRIDFRQADLAGKRLRLSRVDVGLCVNVALTPSATARRRILANVAGCVRPGGRLLLVVPALESDLLVRRRLAGRSTARWRAKKGERLAEGIVDAGGVPTKHFTREELLLLAEDLGCKSITIERVEYCWSTEVVHAPPAWREPYPWDWLAVLERRSPRRTTGA